MMAARFSKKKKNHPCFAISYVCCANQRPVLDQFKVRVGVYLNNETYLALTIHFYLQIQNEGFLSTIWFVSDLNYAQNSILQRLREA